MRDNSSSGPAVCCLFRILGPPTTRVAEWHVAQQRGVTAVWACATLVVGEQTANAAEQRGLHGQETNQSQPRPGQPKGGAQPRYKESPYVYSPYKCAATVFLSPGPRAAGPQQSRPQPNDDGMLPTSCLTDKPACCLEARIMPLDQTAIASLMACHAIRHPASPQATIQHRPKVPIRVPLQSACHPARVPAPIRVPRKPGRHCGAAGPQLPSVCHPSSPARSLFLGENPKPDCLGDYVHLHVPRTKHSCTTLEPLLS